MTVQIIGKEGMIAQYAATDVLYIGVEKGKDIDKWDMHTVFGNLDMDDLRARNMYLVVRMRKNSVKVVYTDDCIAMMKG